MSRDDDLLAMWKQEEPRMDITVEEVTARAAKFERAIKWRNAREIAAGVALTLWIAYSMKDPMPPLVRAGSVALVLGAAFVLHHLRRRGRAGEPAPVTLPTTEVLRRHVAELTRQRDLLLDVPRWYLAPFVPGLVLIALGRSFQDPARWPSSIASLGITAAVFALVAWLNRRAAGKLDEEIAELNDAGPRGDAR